MLRFTRSPKAKRTFCGFMKYLKLSGREAGSRQKQGRGGGAERINSAGGSSRGARVDGRAGEALPARARRDERDSGSD